MARNQTAQTENASDKVPKELQHGREYEHSRVGAARACMARNKTTQHARNEMSKELRQGMDASAAPATILLQAVNLWLPQPTLSPLPRVRKPLLCMQ